MTIGPDKMSHKQKRQNTQSPGKEGKDLKTSHKSQKLWCVGGAEASWLLNLAHLGATKLGYCCGYTIESIINRFTQKQIHMSLFKLLS